MVSWNGFATDADLLTAAEVGQRLRLPLSTVYYLAKAGKLRGFRVGRSWRFPEGEIERLQNTRMPHILIVDDQEIVRRLVVTVLGARGCSVEQAADLCEARNMARETEFDVLFVDLRLPDGAGTDLIRELQDTYQLDRMVLTSALPELARGTGLSELPGVSLLPKPLSADGLVACVERITGVQLPNRSENVHGQV